MIPLQTAKELRKNQEDWAEKVGDFAVGELLELKNTTWLDEDEATITPEEFKKRMRLESITVSPNGEFEFWHDDGDLFWGHSIQVSGNLKDGLTDANIQG